MASTVSVSVVLPTYNRADIVPRAIRSVLDQTYADLELIIVDGSTDRTDRVVSSFSDDRIVYIRNERREGVSNARNCGLLEATGEFIGFIDSDDIWLANKLERQLEAFDTLDESYGLVYCARWNIQRGRGRVISYRDLGSGDVSNRVLKRFPATSTVLIRKECLQKVGFFDPGLNCGEDRDMWIRFSKYYKFHYLDEPLALVCTREDSLSRDRLQDLLGRKRLLAKHHTLFAKNPSSFQRQYLYLGLCCAELGNLQECRTYLDKAIRCYPLGTRPYFALLVSLLGFRPICQAIRLCETIRQLTAQATT